MRQFLVAIVTEQHDDAKNVNEKRTVMGTDDDNVGMVNNVMLN